MLTPRVASIVAIVVGVTWGALSTVHFWHPEYGSPVRLLDYLAVVLFSVALATLAPAAWLIVNVVGQVDRAHRPTAVAVIAAGAAFGLLTLADGGVVLTIVAWVVAGASVGFGPSAVIRAAAVIVAVCGLLGGFGNLIEDGFGAKALGSSLYLLGAGGSVVGLAGMTVGLAIGRHLRLAALSVVTLAGVFSSIQYGGGLIVLAVWLLFAAWLSRAGELIPPALGSEPPVT